MGLLLLKSPLEGGQGDIQTEKVTPTKLLRLRSLNFLHKSEVAFQIFSPDGVVTHPSRYSL
jgi:hypothetical protein